MNQYKKTNKHHTPFNFKLSALPSFLAICQSQISTPFSSFNNFPKVCMNKIMIFIKKGVALLLSCSIFFESITPAWASKQGQDMPDLSDQEESSRKFSPPKSLKEKKDEEEKKDTDSSPPALQKAYSIRSSDSLYYTDEDISVVVEATLHHSSFPVGYAENCKYLLKKKDNNSYFIQDEEDQHNYIVAITDAVDTVGASLNIDYFLDKDTHQKSVAEEIFEKTLDRAATIKDALNPYGQLLSIIEETKKDREIEAISTILDVEHENVEKILSRFQQELDTIRSNKKDVFDEIFEESKIKPLVLGSGPTHIKILFPYNRISSHWLTGEIRIHKEGEQYAVEIFAHDPMSQGEMDGANFNRVEEAIKKRIKDFHPTAQFLPFERKKSPYGKRQGDSISCGAIVAEDILKRITGSLNSFYSFGARKLRRKHIEIAQETDGHLPFVERNKAKVDFITKHKESLKAGNLVIFLSKDENPSSPKPPSQEKSGEKYFKDFLELIQSVEQNELKECLVKAFQNEEFYRARDGSYIVGIQTALSQKPLQLQLEGITLSDKDIDAISKLERLLLSPQGTVKRDPHLIYRLSCSIGKPIESSKQTQDNDETEESNSQSSTSSDEEESSFNPSFHDVLQSQDKIGLIKALYIGGKIYEVFEKIFDTSQPLEFSTSFPAHLLQNPNFLEIFNNKNSLLQKAKDLISNFNFNSSTTEEEHNNLLEMIVRVLMVLRPGYFSNISDSGPVSSEITFKILQNFLEEFVNNGPLEKLERFFKSKVEQEQNPFIKFSTLWFIDLMINFLKTFATKPGMFGELLRSLTPEQMDRHLKSTFHHLKIMDPSLADLSDQTMLEQHIKEKSKKRDFAQLVKLLKGITTQDDLMEENFLRSFSEHLHRENLGKAFYKMACESFTNPTKENKRVRQMWALSLLDTINRHPLEARSRMPARSFDGQTAPNFGYLMSRSASYEDWIRKSPITLATADIIIDSFDYVTAWGKNLHDSDIEEFLDLFEFNLTFPYEDQAALKEFYKKNGERVDKFFRSSYSKLMGYFERYLLRRHFNISLKEDANIIEALKKLADDQNVCLRDIARQHLKNFIQFCIDTPQINNNPKSDRRGFVFGIGFNGPLFNAPNYFRWEKNELFLAFSESRRMEDGYYLFLCFLEFFAREPNTEFISQIKINDINFLRYKPLILNHLKNLVELYTDVDTRSESFQQHKKFEEFYLEIEHSSSLNNLNPQLFAWMEDISNWYRLPVTKGSYYVPIKIAKELSKEEKILQEYTRQLLLDAVVKRPFAEKSLFLSPVLFLHWKKRLLKRAATEEELAKTIKNAKSFKQISAGEAKQKVLNELDFFVGDLNDDIRSHWLKSIQIALNADLDKKETAIKKQRDIREKEIEKIRREICGLEKQLTIKEKKKPDESNPPNIIPYYKQISENYSKIRDRYYRIRDIYLEIKNLYVELANASYIVEDLSAPEKYKTFSVKFFEDRDVGQCIEPLFSKVLGHDRFFPIHVCNKPAESGKVILGHLNGGRNFIDPCTPRCQHHVLGHLYVGDMCSNQTANQLDINRRIHKLGSVPNRLIPARIFQ